MIRCDDKVNLDSTIVRFAITDAVLRDACATVNRLVHKHTTKSKRGRRTHVTRAYRWTAHRR